MQVWKGFVFFVSAASFLWLQTDSITLDEIASYAMHLLPSNGCFIAPPICPNENISFYLYTRGSQDRPYKLDPTNYNSIYDAPFVDGAPIKIIIHGYTGSANYSPNMELRPAYFEHSEYNIISVDWSPMAMQPCYIQATFNVRVVGKCAANIIDLLLALRPEIKMEQFHVIGFSLGAHIAGILCRNVEAGNITRLTGLDPALPLYDSFFSELEYRINSRDAQYVDAYHTNAGIKGKIQTVGDLDVYFNNGAFQPGCNCNSSCDHVRAVEYYAETINPKNKMYAFPCWSFSTYTLGRCAVNNESDLILIGEHLDTRLQGVYYSFTNEKSPYAISKSVYLNGSDYTGEKEYVQGFRIQRIVKQLSNSDTVGIIPVAGDCLSVQAMDSYRPYKDKVLFVCKKLVE